MTYAQMLFYKEAIHQMVGLSEDKDGSTGPRKLSGEARKALFAKAGKKNGTH